jgi:hypothetical protein
VKLAGVGPPDVDYAPPRAAGRERPLVPPKSAAKVVAPPPGPQAAPAEETPAADPPSRTEPPFQPAAGAIIKRRSARRRWRLWRTIATLFVITAAVCTAGWGSWWMYSTTSTQGEAATSVARTRTSYVLPSPSPGWKKDAELRLRMQVATAARRSNPAAAMAFVAHDYMTRLPAEGELVDEALAKLHNQFKRVEWEKAPGEFLLGGERVLAIKFDATTAEDVDVLGMAYLLAYRGFGYWLILWAPAADRDLAEPELERVRQSFALSPEFREGWQEGAPRPQLISLREAGLTLACTKTVWEEEETTGYDPKAVRVLKGTFPLDGTSRQRDRHAGKVAIVQVLVLDSAGAESAGAKARAYVLESQKDPARGNYPKTTLTTIKAKSGDELDNDVKLGTCPGRLVKLRMANTEDRERFVVLGAVPRPKGQLLVIWCECDWSLRDYWDQEFGTLLNSLRPLNSATDSNEARGAEDGQ